MEDVIDELRERAEGVPTPLRLPDDDELTSIEEELLIPLPGDLREFLLQVSDIIVGSLEPVTVTDCQAHTYLPEVAAEAWAAGIPRYLIPICQDGLNYYCISEDGQISLWIENEESDQVWSSIWQWAKEIWLGGVDN